MSYTAIYYTVIYLQVKSPSFLYRKYNDYINSRTNSTDPSGLLGLRSALKIGPMCLLEIFNCFSVNHQSNIANERSRRFRGSRPHSPIIQLYGWLVLKRNQSKSRAPHWIGLHTEPSKGIYSQTPFIPPPSI